MTLEHTFTAVLVIASRYLAKLQPTLTSAEVLDRVLADSRLELHNRQRTTLVRLIDMDRSRQ